MQRDVFQVREIPVHEFARGRIVGPVNHQRLADLVDLQGGEVVVELAGLGIEVDADEIERAADLGGVEQ